MAADITNTIMDAIIATYPGYFNNGINTTNPLYLKTILKSPLQDDPTLRAFYLEVGPDTTMATDDNHWRMPVQSIRRGKLGTDAEKPELEIGGGYKMINFFIIKGWIPMQTSRELAHENAGKAVRRLERSFARLMNSSSFRMLATDDGLEYTNSGYPNVFNIDGTHYELRGGDTEWYPQISMRFHVFTEIAREYWA